MAATRIGEILKSRGLLNDEQIGKILERQKVTGESFGSLAATEFGVQEAELWRAWAMQIIEYCPRINPSTLKIPERALAFLSAREAWSYRMLPVDLNENELVIATTADRLPNAMAMAQIRSPVPAVFAVADRDELEETIRLVYKMTETPSIVPTAA
jgi:hypothetical protein